MTPVNYECDLKHPACAFAISKILLTEKSANGTLVTLTPGLDKLEEAATRLSLRHERQHGLAQATLTTSPMIINNTVMSSWPRWRLKSPASRLFTQPFIRRRSKKTTGFCAGNSPVTGEFPAQMASNAANGCIWWRHRKMISYHTAKHSINLKQYSFEAR